MNTQPIATNEYSAHPFGRRRRCAQDFVPAGRRFGPGEHFDFTLHFTAPHPGCGSDERGYRSERGFGGRGRGPFEGGFGGRGFGGGRGRLFDAGDIKLVILKLLSEQPSYGYQLIKTMENRLSGGYTPSAGVIYPTLTLLEEEGLATASTENNKKVYSVTEEGRQYLENHKQRLDELFERLEQTGKGFERGRSPEIMQAFMGLRSAVIARVSRESVTPDHIRKITAAIQAATKAIDEL